MQRRWLTFSQMSQLESQRLFSLDGFVRPPCEGKLTPSISLFSGVAGLELGLREFQP